MLNLTNIKLFAILFLISFKLCAQPGPELPCVNCDQFTKRVQPATGLWHNPDQLGTTFSIEVQNRQLKGVLNTFDNKGIPTWYAFDGFLIPSDQTGVMWEVDTTLNRYANGGCFTCDFLPSELIESSKQLHINFNHLGHATFNIDSGLDQNIIHINFGNNEFDVFDDYTSLKMLDFTGFWVISFRNDPLVQAGSLVSGFHPPKIYAVRHPFYANTKDELIGYGYSGNELTNVPEIILFHGSFGCTTLFDQSKNIIGPECGFGVSLGSSIKEYSIFNGTISGFGENMLFGETENGTVYKAFRYDYCELASHNFHGNCEDDNNAFSNRIVPVNGFWHNPDQPGIGLNIQVQNRMVMGNYYGFDENGNAVWYTFKGSLSPSSVPDVMWGINADLELMNNGACINCAYQEPSTTELGKQIHIRFNDLAQGIYLIDGGSLHNMVHKNFGVPELSVFPESNPAQIPDIKGYWMLSYRYDTSKWVFGDITRWYVHGLLQPQMVYINDMQSITNGDGTRKYSFKVDALENAPTYVADFGEIECHTELNPDKTLSEPICQFSTNRYPFGDIQFKMNLTSFAESHLYGQSELGHVYKGFRVDYCDLDLENPNFVCEHQDVIDRLFMHGFE